MPRFRPMGLGDIFDEAFDLYRKNFLFLLLISAVVIVPLQLMGPILSQLFPNVSTPAEMLASIFGASVFGGAQNHLGPFLSGPFPFALLYLLFTAVLSVALAGACSACYLEERKSLRKAYRIPLRSLGVLFVTGLFYGFWMLLGALFCFVGALIPLTLFLFTAHTYAIENKRYAQALGRSRRLADGVGGTVFAALLILWAISAVVSLGISLPLAYGFDILLHIAPDSNMLFSSSVGHNGDAQRQALAQVSDAISSLLLTPFVFSVVTVLYYDLRIRKEAFDVVLLAQGLDYPPLAALSGYLPPAYAPPPAGKERERQ